MADPCYCSVRFETGEELDEALWKAKNVDAYAQRAEEAKEAIENMGVAAVSLPNGSEPTVTKTEENGTVKLTFGMPPGPKGEPGTTGLPGATPVRGTDYWTESDKQELVDLVLLAAVPSAEEASF